MNSTHRPQTLRRRVAMWLGTLLAVFGLGSSIAGTNADVDVDDAVRSIGMTVGAWRQTLEKNEAVRGLAVRTEHQQGVGENIVRMGQLDRAMLASRLRRLPAGSREAAALERFLQDWPEASVATGVLAPDRQFKLDRDLKALARVFPDRSDTWGPPWRLFRP